jgi:formyl-CoA transferase
VEPPGGETMRDRHPMRDGHSASFGQFNAGKRSLELDLKRPAAREALRRLIATADVLVENFRPGVMERLDFSPTIMCAEHPRLVYCAISGYGQTGPSAQLPAYAPVIHAASGYDLAHLAVQEERDRPDNCGLVIADILAGAYAFGAVCAALRRREVNGKGALIDVSMLESMMQLLPTAIQATQFPMPPSPRKWLYGPLRTTDGFVTVAVASGATFSALARALGREEWLLDPRYQRFTGVQAGWADLHPAIEGWTSVRSQAEAVAALAAAGVPCAPYRSVAEAMRDPQLAHRGALAEVRDRAGSFHILAAPFQLADVPTPPGSRVAALGEDGPSVLRELGFGDSDWPALGLSVAEEN